MAAVMTGLKLGSNTSDLSEKNGEVNRDLGTGFSIRMKKMRFESWLNRFLLQICFPKKVADIMQNR